MNKGKFRFFIIFIFSMCFIFVTFVNASDLPFDVKEIRVNLKNTYYSGSDLFEADVTNRIFFEDSTMCSFHELPSYTIYLNEVYLSYQNSASPYYEGPCDLILKSFTSSVHITSNSISDFLKVGENELIIVSYDSTINSEGNYVKKEILKEGEGIDSQGNIVSCENCARIKEYNEGPNVGVIVKFNLTQEQLDSQNFVINKFPHTSAITSVAYMNLQFKEDLVEGRRIFVSGLGKANSEYSIYFNNFLASEIKTNSFGRFRNTFLIESDDWISTQNNFVVLKDSSDNEIKYPLIPDTSAGTNEWSSLLWLNNTHGYYGDNISIYGSGLKPNTKYALGTTYEGIPGNRINVFTNNLGEFEIDNYEVNPPIFTNIMLAIKHLFSGNPAEMPSEKEVRAYLSTIPGVEISLDISSKESIGTIFRLCNYYNSSNDLRPSGYCLK